MSNIVEQRVCSGSVLWSRIVEQYRKWSVEVEQEPASPASEPSKLAQQASPASHPIKLAKQAQQA